MPVSGRLASSSGVTHAHGRIASIRRGVDFLERALVSRGKALRMVRYDRGGGHELFYDVGYWWDDFQAFLQAHLAPR